MREAHRTLLGSVPGVTVVGEAVDSDEAIGAILRTKPDLVLLDLTLRTGSGLPVLQTIKLLRPAIRVFVVTNHVSEPYRNRCRDAGADDFFDKSSDLDRLRNACAAMVVPPGSG